MRLGRGARHGPGRRPRRLPLFTGRINPAGEFTLYTGGLGGSVRRSSAAAGNVVPLAGGTPHTIRNESAADALAFVVHAPGAPMEGFVRAAAALAADGSPSMDAVLAIAAQHGIELLGPIPSETEP